MSTLFPDRDSVSALALNELLELFLKYNPKLDKDDATALRKSFSLLIDMFPADKLLPDTGNFKAGYLLWFQEYLIGKNHYANTQIKKHVNFIKRVFCWASKRRYDRETWDNVSGIVSPALAAEIKSIELINGGKINPPRTSVPLEYIEALSPYIDQTINDMLHIQILAAFRPGEVCGLRPAYFLRTQEEFAKYDLLYDRKIWCCIMEKHKTDRHIGTRFLPVGLEAQDILAKYLDWDKPDSPIFRTKTGKPFSRNYYSQIIREAIAENGLKKFVPHQVRHKVASNISKIHGRDTARAYLGHTSEKTTAIYDHSDYEKTVAVVFEQNKIWKKKRKTIDYLQERKGRPIKLRIFTGE